MHIRAHENKNNERKTNKQTKSMPHHKTVGDRAKAMAFVTVAATVSVAVRARLWLWLSF